MSNPVPDPQHCHSIRMNEISGDESILVVVNKPLENMSVVKKGLVGYRASDPDPYRIRIQSGQWIRLRIHIQNPDPDPGGQKLPTKVEKNLEISCFEVLDVLF